MTSADFDAELVREYDWRAEEMRRLKNLIASAQAADRDGLRKSLVLFLYSHFEGFCVFSLQHYLSAVNSRCVPCREASPAIVAGAWEKMFNSMETGGEKSKVFKQTLPNDTGLHRHWRRRHFVEDIEQFYGWAVELKEDIIDSESNLKAAVLRRNLFILGLDHTYVDSFATDINSFLSARNRLAHGADRRGVTKDDYEKWESMVTNICRKLIEFLSSAVRDSSYERDQPDYII